MQTRTSPPADVARSARWAPAGTAGHAVAQTRERVVQRFGSQPGVRQKSVDQRCALVAAVGRFGEDVADATMVYRMLLDMGQPLSMSQVYRGLQALANEGLLATFWLLEDGRPRRGYALPQAQD